MTDGKTPRDLYIESEERRGFTDGYDGNQATPVAGPAAARAAYNSGYLDGQAAYRRTLEPDRREVNRGR